MTKNTTILLKPHHFLDIIKLYGFGLILFIPDFRYGHNFYKVANLVLENPKSIIALTTQADDVCKPCRFLEDGKCTDRMRNFIFSKEEWNQTIDKRILKHLGLKENDKLTALEFSKLAREKLTVEMIIRIWRERPEKETKKRVKHLLNGLNKYIRKHNDTKK